MVMIAVWSADFGSLSGMFVFQAAEMFVFFPDLVSFFQKMPDQLPVRILLSCFSDLAELLLQLCIGQSG